MEFGVPPMIALATQLCHAVGTNFTTFLTYKRKMDVDFHLAIYILLGGTLGALFEWIILKTSANSRFAFNKFIYVYILILTIFGVIMLVQSYKTWRHNDTAKYKKSVFLRRWMLYLPLHKIFVRSRAEMSIIIPFFVGFLAGLLVSSLGGGNNLFMAPIITYLIGRISPVVYGTTALAGCVITAIIALVYSTNDYCCDILFVLLLFVGASVGSWIGVQLTYKVKRYFIYAIGALIVFLMATRQIYNLIHGIFSKNYNSKIDLSQSIVGTIAGGIAGENHGTLTNCYQTTQAEYNKTLAPKRIAAEYTPEADEEGEEYDGLWANVYDVMPDYFGNLLEDYGFLKVYEGGLEYEGLYYVACISLEDHLDNSALIDLATDYIVDVSLSDQLFRKDNQWYTLCLPFDLDNFTGTPLEGATVKTLSSSSYDAGTNTLTMDFSDNLTAIEAGKPYIVKWTEGEDIIFPMFAGVTVSTDAADVQTTYADFIGTYNYIDYAEEDRSILLLIGDALEYPEEGAHNIACSAYFRLKEGLVAGEPLRIVLNFNDSSQDINLLTDEEQQTVKFIQNGKIYIRRGGNIYDVTGIKIK